VLEIDDPKFLDEDYDVTVSDGAIVLANWSDGHNHLYLYRYDKEKPLAADAKLEKQLTRGAFEVGDVYRVDPSHKVVDYASNEGNPLEQQIWRVNFNAERAQLSSGAGFHEATFSPDGSTFTDKFSARLQPPAMRLCHEATAGSAADCRAFWETHALDSYHLRAPEQMEVKARDGSALYATLLLPAEATDRASVPLIVNPYGGPGEQTVVNQWKDSLLFDELLAQHGFAVLHADNRGMGKRGRAFAQAAYRNFGPVQLEDQMTIVDDALAKYPQLDPKRLGWWGWSWGGTFTLYAMTHSGRFKTGVAVAPVTDWRDYDSIYTERYLGLPAEDEDGYRDFSVVNSASNLKGHLLLVHGTGDDNVHIENTVQFVQKLIDAGIPYDLQIYPRKTHSIAGPDVRTHLYNRILAQFEEYLKPKDSLDQKPEIPASAAQ
jgi:dipeptidyl-peptidase-4